MNSEEEIENLKKEIQKLKKENKKLNDENKEFKEIFSSVAEITSGKAKKGILKKIKDALRKLAFYESPNMPSSAPKLNDYAQNDKKKKKKRKRGGQKGHQGTTRKKPDHFDLIQMIDLIFCPYCKTKLGDPLKTVRTRIVEDIIFENTLKNILYVILQYYCSKCKKVVSGIPADVLSKMNFGTNITSLTSFLKYKYRLTFDLIKSYFQDFYGLVVSKGAYAYQIKKVAEILGEPYEEIKKEIRNADSRSIDETGEKWCNSDEECVNKKAFGWKYITPKASLYTITGTRSHSELYETLGDDCHGGVGCDGHKAYNMLKNAKIQRCWEHIWRPARYEIKEGKPTKELEEFYKQLVHIIKLAEDYKENNFPFKNPEKVKARYYTMLGYHIEKHYNHPIIKKIIASIHGYMEKDELFTFLEFKDLKWHNNDTERDIREEVIQRKISGGVRSDEGAERRSILRSVIRTYEKKGMNFMNEVQKLVVLSNLAE